MNTPSVVPTLRRHTTENQPFVGLSAVSCESRVSRCRRLAKDWECLNRNALAFLRWASIRTMMRKLCQKST
jgi:hypothetical protein